MSYLNAEPGQAPAAILDISRAAASASALAADLLTRDDRLNVMILSWSVAEFAMVLADRGDSGFQRAALRVRSMACDPFILGGKMAREIQENPLSRSCALAIFRTGVKPAYIQARAAWELVIDGLWVPSAILAKRSGS